MPKPPNVSLASRQIPGAVYSSLVDRLDISREIYPLHVGDTYLEPPPGSRCWELGRDAELHTYTATDGLKSLREALAVFTENKTQQAVDPDHVYVTAGATAGLSVAMQALLAPGDEVLILAPYWPLIAGMTLACGARVRPIDILDLDDIEALRARLEAATSSATVALYYSSPNNPSGRLLPETWIEALAGFAREHDLWLLADDVYDLYCFAGAHVSALGMAPERTIVANSASKAFTMAGNRCGWLIAPTAVLGAMQKLGTHAFYSAPTASQRALLAAITDSSDWVANTRQTYRSVGVETASAIGVPPPEGGTFLFVDVGDALGSEGLEQFLESCAEHNLLLAPGPSFGPYPRSVRLCFTAAPPEVVARAVRVLVEQLDAFRAGRAAPGKI